MKFRGVVFCWDIYIDALLLKIFQPLHGGSHTTLHVIRVCPLGSTSGKSILDQSSEQSCHI